MSLPTTLASLSAVHSPTSPALLAPQGCFGTAWGMGTELTVPVVFYTVLLLNLPRLWMAIFFLKGVETVTEAVVSLRRINRFLGLPEAPRPTVLPDDKVAGEGGSRARGCLREAMRGWVAVSLSPRGNDRVSPLPSTPIYSPPLPSTPQIRSLRRSAQSPAKGPAPTPPRSSRWCQKRSRFGSPTGTRTVRGAACTGGRGKEMEGEGASGQAGGLRMGAGWTGP